MPCCGPRCYPAIDWALQGSQKQEALAIKFCNWVDLIALIRNQINLDIAAGLTSPITTTQTLAAELIVQLDAEPTVYTATSGVSSYAATANEFGLVAEINCTLLNVLVRACVEADPLVNLGVIANGTLVYADDDSATIQFLCCLSDHFRSLQNFLERYAKAKACESPC